MKKRNILENIEQKVRWAESPLDRKMRGEGKYNYYLWLKSEPFYYYLLHRSLCAESKKSQGAIRFFEQNNLPRITERELFFLYELAHLKERSHWSASQEEFSPFTRTYEEIKLDEYLQAHFKYKPGKNKNSQGIIQVPCFPRKLNKVLIGPYAVDIFLFGFRPPHGIWSQDGKRQPKWVATAVEVNGLIHESVVKMKKDQYMRAALEQLNIFVMEITNEEVKKGFRSSIIRNFRSIMGHYKGATDQRTTDDLKLKICMRTAATHFTLGEMDYILREKFGRDYKLEEGFNMILESKLTLSMRRKLIDKKRIADAQGEMPRPRSMGHSKKMGKPEIKYLIRNGVPCSNSGIVAAYTAQESAPSHQEDVLKKVRNKGGQRTVLVTDNQLQDMGLKDVQDLAREIGTPDIEGIQSARILRNKIIRHGRERE